MESTSNNNQNKKTQLEDVAAALGLSKSTVSRAISGKGRIGQETRDRVLRYINENNYRGLMSRVISSPVSFERRCSFAGGGPQAFEPAPRP